MWTNFFSQYNKAVIKLSHAHQGQNLNDKNLTDQTVLGSTFSFINKILLEPAVDSSEIIQLYLSLNFVSYTFCINFDH